MADINGDGRDEVITGAGLPGGPQVRIFKASGVPTVTFGFFAYYPLFLGGVHVASSDIDNDGRAEIITGAGFSGGPHVRLFEPYHLY